METNKQNTALLVVIAVATLLVAVVGATFAYFTATNNSAAASTVTVKAGIMTISYSDGSDALNLRETDFQPSDAVLIDKTFNVAGKNTTTGNGGTGLNMPFTVDFEYTNSFTSEDTGNGAITYEFFRTDTAGNTLVGINNIVSAGKLATAATETKLRLVDGYFKPDANTTTTLTFNLKLYFKDTGANQNKNKGKELSGKITINSEGTEANKATTAA